MVTMTATIDDRAARDRQLLARAAGCLDELTTLRRCGAIPTSSLVAEAEILSDELRTRLAD